MSGYECKAWFGGVELKERGVTGSSRTFTVAYAHGEVARRWVTIVSGERGDFVMFGMWPPQQQMGSERDPPIRAFEAMWADDLAAAFDWLVGGHALDEHVTVKEWAERKAP